MRKYRRAVVATLGVLGSALASPSAGARSIGALNGHGSAAIGNKCFVETNGGAVNTCPAPPPTSPFEPPPGQGFELPLPIDTATAFTVTFLATAGVQCDALVYSQDNVFVGNSGFAASSGGLTTVQSPTVPPGGILYLLCALGGSGGALYSVNWN